MDEIELDQFKALLLTEGRQLKELQESSRSLSKPVDLDQSTVGRLSRMDAMQSQAMAQESKRRRETQIIRIDAALRRIDEDEFGFCAVCEETIDRRRLELDPANPFCVSCASKV